VIIKHNNACGVASKPTLAEAYRAALATDPISAFGGVLICNRPIDNETAKEIDKLFCEVVAAPNFEADTAEMLQSKKNRMLLRLLNTNLGRIQFRSLLGGVAIQERDMNVGGRDTEVQCVTKRSVTKEQMRDLIFANKIVKHSKSNAIVLSRDGVMLSSGIGQTSRVDALKQVIGKAKNFGFSLKGAALASDAFFPFSDCVEIAYAEGIETIIQPGGSVRDTESIEFCDSHNMAMIFTGMRHFKH
jgi:phosphoribosylaminoimidazolecarboxamide formyltransferase/IMP cyclohydrolase